jgi:hypothetical protein
MAKAISPLAQGQGVLGKLNRPGHVQPENDDRRFVAEYESGPVETAEVATREDAYDGRKEGMAREN